MHIAFTIVFLALVVLTTRHHGMFPLTLSFGLITISVCSGGT